MFAIEEINRNSHILPNTSLGFDLYNVHSNHWDTLQEPFIYLTGMGVNIPNYTCRRQKAAALLTGTSWETSACIGRLLNLYKYPQITFGPFDTILGDRAQFSSLYQTAPKDTFLSHGIAILMVYFSWTWVGLVLIDDHSGAEILSDLRGEMDRNRVCIAFVAMIPDNMISSLQNNPKTTLPQIQKSSANVVIIYGESESLRGMIFIIANQLFNSKVWVMKSRWDFTAGFESLIFDPFHGSLIFAHHYTEISDFRKFIQTYNPSKYPEDYILAQLWQDHFNCSYSEPDCKILGNCVANASVKMFHRNIWETNMSEESYNVYNSVYAVAHSLHELTLKQVQIYPHGKWDVNTYPWKLPCSVCSESCVPGFRKSPQEGKAACCYDCTHCLDNEISNETDMDYCVRCPESHYANREQKQCLQKAVTFLAYEDPLGKAITCLSLGFSALTAGVLGVFVKYHYTPIVKANNQALTYILLITLIFCFLCPLLFIGHPNTATCILQQSTFAILFTLALSTVLAKSIIVVLAFRITVPGRLTRWIMTSRAPNFIIPVCTLIQLVLCGIWLSISTPFVESDAYSEHDHIIVICNKGSIIAFY
ncbi:hypothetical protein A6R68_21928, partial [Neotoma lepida]